MTLDFDKSSWKRVTFGDVVTNINDYFEANRDGVLPYVAGPHINGGEPTVVAYGSTDDDKFPPTFKRKFQRNDVLLHSRGIEKLAVVDREGVTGEKLFVLRSRNTAVLLQEYLIWLLLSPDSQAYMADNFTGSVNKFLNWKPLASFEFDLPPLDEQKRIADLLWAIENHLGTLTAELEALALVRGGSIEEGIPDTAHSVSLGDAASIASGLTLGPARRSMPDSAPYLRVANVQRGYLDLGDIKEVGATPTEIASKGIRKGDVLVVEGHASVLEIGRAAIWDRDDSPLHQNHLFRVRASAGFRPRFLLEWINSNRGRNYIRTVAKSTSGLNTINSTVLKAMPVPSVDVVDQDRVLATLALIDRVRDAIKREIHGLRIMKISFLVKFFGGN